MRYLIFFGLAISTAAAAQNDSPAARLRFGFTAGVTRTWIDVNPNANQTSVRNNATYGARFGGMLTYSISRRFFASAQLSYFWMNVDATTETTLTSVYPSTGSIVHRNEWFEFPFDFNFVFNPGSKFKVFAGVGVSLMHLVDVVKDDGANHLGGRYEFNTAVLGQVGVDAHLGQRMLRISLVTDKTLREVIKPQYASPASIGYVIPRYDYAYTTLSLKATYFF